MTESQIQSDIKEYLKYRGYFVFKVHQQGKYTHPGITDLIAVKNGHAAFIEVKNKKGKMSPEQIQFMEDIVSHGGKHIIARGIEDVRQLA